MIGNSKGPPVAAVPDVSDIQPIVELRGLSKSFGATQAVSDVSFAIRRQSVVGLVGENGAGKSTVARILAGVVKADEGQLLVEGRAVTFGSPHQALTSGVAMMAQEILLVPDLTVEENVLLGDLPRRGIFPARAEMRERFRQLVELSGFNLDPRARVGDLRLADQQKVEIMRALSTDARLIVMDEPSAALAADEVSHLHDSIRLITERGSSILFISHFLEEVLEITSDVAIMRDGKLIRFGPTEEETVGTLVSGMVGREMSTGYLTPTASSVEAPPLLEVRGLTREGVLSDVSFDVRAGEILGLAGLVGSGRTEIARCLFGADAFDSGTIAVGGETYRPRNPRDAIAAGVFMLPESRKDQGLLLDASVRDNVLLSKLSERSRWGWLTGSWGMAAGVVAERVGLRYQSLKQRVGTLSGGNQQKVLLGRALDAGPRLLIADEPTRGVDIAAKRAIHRLLESWAAEGVSVLFISSELQEVLGVCSRVLAVHCGRVAAEFTPPYDHAEVLNALFGNSGGN